MPESVKDRCTKAHEYIFLLSKSPKYYFDNEAIKEHCVTKNKQTNKKNTHGKYKTKENEAKNRQGIHSNRGDKLIEVRTKLPVQKDLVDFLRSKTTAKILANSTDISLTKIEHWFRYDETGFAYPTIEDWNKVKEFIDDWSNEFNLIDEALTYYELKTDEVIHTNKKNKRSVWTVSTKSFKGAHFATFPMDLIEPCVLAGCPEDGIVLDPFAGSGTTGIVAVNNKRNACLIDLSSEYIEIAKKRIKEQAEVEYEIK
jgi:site-specific DNA-methyltransferase (adenine-specific)